MGGIYFPPGTGSGGGVISLNGQTGAISLTSTGGTISVTTPTSSTINIEVVGASGFVVGPASATDNALARYDGATGKIIQNSNAILADTGTLTLNKTATHSGSTLVIAPALDPTNGDPVVIIRSMKNTGTIGPPDHDLIRYLTANGTVPLGSVDYLGRWYANPGEYTTFGPAFVDATMTVGFRGSSTQGLVFKNYPGNTNGSILVMQDASGASMLEFLGNSYLQSVEGASFGGGKILLNATGHIEVNWNDGSNGSPSTLTFGQSGDSPTGAEGAMRLDVVSNGTFGGNITPLAINGYNNATPYLVLTSWSGPDPVSPGSRNSSILFGATASGEAFIQGPAGFSMQEFGGGPGWISAGYAAFNNYDGTPLHPFQVGSSSGYGTVFQADDGSSVGWPVIKFGDIDSYNNGYTWTLNDSTGIISSNAYYQAEPFRLNSQAGVASRFDIFVNYIFKGNFGVSAGSGQLLTGDVAGDYVFRSEGGLMMGSGGDHKRLYIDSSGNLEYLGPVKLSNYTSNGFVKTTSGNGTISVDTNSYQILDASLTSISGVSWVQGDLLYWSGTDIAARLAKDANATRYLSNQGTSNNPSWNQINLANGVTGDLPFANLTQIGARSVLGVTGNATADVAGIQGTADQVLVVNGAGTTLTFGTVATGGITNSAVTYAKIQNVSTTKRFLGRNTTGAGVVEELTPQQGSNIADSYKNTTFMAVKFGSGNGGDANFTLGSFNQVNFHSLDNYNLTDPGSNYNAAGDYYLTPVAGIYQIIIKLRITDGYSPGENFFIDAGDLGIMGDGPDGLWSDDGTNRWTAINVIENSYAAGTQIGMWTYSDSGTMTASDGYMSVKLLFAT